MYYNLLQWLLNFAASSCSLTKHVKAFNSFMNRCAAK